MWGVLRSEYRVETAATYEEGVRRAEGRAYASIVVSLYPKGGDRGRDLLSALRDANRHDETAVVAVCGPSLGQDRASLLSAGFDEVLRMPFTQSELLTVLDRAVDSS